MTRKNCYKCDLETIINNDSQYFQINLRDFEAEAESKLQNISKKQDNASTIKYRKELTPIIKFQPDRIFKRNDLFEKIIKSCKATNAEFTMVKQKLGICPYEENYYEEELIKIQYEEKDEELTKTLTKELTKELIEESDEELDKESDKESYKESYKESDEESGEELMKELREIISPKKDKNTTDWYDKNKF